MNCASIRGEVCYENELTALKSLVREMGNMLNEWAYATESFGGVVNRFSKTQDILARTEVKAIIEDACDRGTKRLFKIKTRGLL